MKVDKKEQKTRFSEQLAELDKIDPVLNLFSARYMLSLEKEGRYDWPERSIKWQNYEGVDCLIHISMNEDLKSFLVWLSASRNKFGAIYKKESIKEKSLLPPFNKDMMKRLLEESFGWLEAVKESELEFSTDLSMYENGKRRELKMTTMSEAIADARAHSKMPLSDEWLEKYGIGVPEYVWVHVTTKNQKIFRNCLISWGCMQLIEANMFETPPFSPDDVIGLERIQISNPVKKGDRFITLSDIAAHGQTHWRAPFTGGFDCVIPKGTVLTADLDAGENTIGFSLVPEEYERMEKILVPEQDRNSLKYGGYSFHFLLDDIGTKLQHAARHRE